jgi:hypothetical protein
MKKVSTDIGAGFLPQVTAAFEAFDLLFPAAFPVVEGGTKKTP